MQAPNDKLKFKCHFFCFLDPPTKHYSFQSIVSITAGLMCFIHFKMSINVQVMPQMYILLTGNLPCLSCVRRKQQIKECPEIAYYHNQAKLLADLLLFII